MTQTDMSQITRIERSRYKRIEAGARLYFDEAKQICDALEKEFQWLSEGAELSDLKGSDLRIVKQYRELPRNWRDIANRSIDAIYETYEEIKKTKKD